MAKVCIVSAASISMLAAIKNKKIMRGFDLCLLYEPMTGAQAKPTDLSKELGAPDSMNVQARARVRAYDRRAKLYDVAPF